MTCSPAGGQRAELVLGEMRLLSGLASQDFIFLGFLFQFSVTHTALFHQAKVSREALI